uniref:Putative metal dependent phosphohydrolase n=1 Tax=Magnetococcus massalia (strain MO-1) TaxID=451514 RepID=A0A1S7LEC9_MAGMO|nr:putative metal dependent phosphohydrolase [Candidatus Magnetococcus massalia]
MSQDQASQSEEMDQLAAQLAELGEDDAFVDPREQEEQMWVEETTYALELMSATERELAEVFEQAADGEPLDVKKLDLSVSRINATLANDSDAMVGLALLRRHDTEGFDHSINSAIYLMTLGHSMGLSETVCNELGMGGLLHDIGKSQLPRDLIQKRGALTDAERKLVNSHVEESMQMLDVMEEIPERVKELVRHHHERLDGTGYPHGLKGDAISQGGRMMAVADCFDAMTSNRSYRKAREGREVLKELMLECVENKSLDTRIVEHFIQGVGIYPLGTLVRLADKRLGVVIRNHSGNLLHPVLRIIAQGMDNKQLEPYMLDLATAGGGEAVRIVSTENPSMTRIDPSRFMPGADCYCV